MSTRGFSKNNVIAGTFVLVAVALAVLASIVISGATEMFTRRTDYHVRFKLTDGAAGLKAGSAVNAGGQPVGRVRSVRVAVEDGRADSVLAVISVRSDLELYEDAIVFLEAPLLGGISTLNIPSAGTGEVAQPKGIGPQLEENEVLDGRLAPPSVLAQAGYGPEQTEQVRQIIRDASETTARINRITAKAEADLDPLLTSVRTAVTDFQTLAADVKGRTPAWTAHVDTVLERSATAATEFEKAVADSRARLEEIRKIIATGQASLDRNAEGIANMVDSLESAAAKIDQESMPLVNETLTAGRDGAKQFQSLGARAESFFAEQSPSMRRIVGNFRLAADQIKLAAIEIRTKPWLLLYTPKTKELESQTLYGAARSYAEAVSDLRAASASLEVAASSQDTTLASDRETIEGMQARLKTAFAEYEKAEQSFLDLLMKAREGG